MLSLRDRLRHEGGFTLVELLATLTIGMVILFAGYALLDRTVQASDEVTDRVSTTERGRGAIESVARVLRSQLCLPGDVTDTAVNDSLSALTAAGDQSVTFYADLGGETPNIQRRRYSFSAGRIVEEVWNPSTTTPAYSYPASPSRTRVLTTGLVPQAVGGVNQPVFRYYGYANTDPSTPTLRLPGPLSDSDLARVVKVDIAFRSKSDRARNDEVSTDLETSVFVRGARVANYTLNPPEYGGPPCGG